MHNQPKVLMKKIMSKQDRTESNPPAVRVLHFPVTQSAQPAQSATHGSDSDAMADAIRKAWTQKKMIGK